MCYTIVIEKYYIKKRTKVTDRTGPLGRTCALEGSDRVHTGALVSTWISLTLIVICENISNSINLLHCEILAIFSPSFPINFIQRFPK